MCFYSDNYDYIMARYKSASGYIMLYNQSEALMGSYLHMSSIDWLQTEYIVIHTDKTIDLELYQNSSKCWT